MTHLIAAALVLQLHNFAGVPSSVAADAASEVTRLYAAVGVSTIWRAAAPADDQSEVIRVIVLPYETGILSHRADIVMGAAVSTPGSSRLAYVYYRPVRAEAERHAASISQVLACAIAHEIGHLLMPDAGHSPAGLMRARWQVQGSGFTVQRSRSGSCSGSGSGSGSGSNGAGRREPQLEREHEREREREP